MKSSISAEDSGVLELSAGMRMPLLFRRHHRELSNYMALIGSPVKAGGRAFEACKLWESQQN